MTEFLISVGGAQRRCCRDLHRPHPQEPPVTFLYALAAFIALALTVYLTVALLKPEWFE